MWQHVVGFVGAVHTHIPAGYWCDRIGGVKNRVVSESVGIYQSPSTTRCLHVTIHRSHLSLAYI